MHQTLPGSALHYWATFAAVIFFEDLHVWSLFRWARRAFAKGGPGSRGHCCRFPKELSLEKADPLMSGRLVYITPQMGIEGCVLSIASRKINNHSPTLQSSCNAWSREEFLRPFLLHHSSIMSFFNSLHQLMRTTLGKLLQKQQGKCRWCELSFREEDQIEIDHITPKARAAVKNSVTNWRFTGIVMTKGMPNTTECITNNGPHS